MRSHSSPKSSVGGALRQQVVDAPDAEFQLVEAETDLDQNPSFPGVPTSTDWVIQGFWESRRFYG